MFFVARRITFHASGAVFGSRILPGTTASARTISAVERLKSSMNATARSAGGIIGAIILELTTNASGPTLPSSEAGRFAIS